MKSPKWDTTPVARIQRAMCIIWHTLHVKEVLIWDIHIVFFHLNVGNFSDPDFFWPEPFPRAGSPS